MAWTELETALGSKGASCICPKVQPFPGWTGLCCPLGCLSCSVDETGLDLAGPGGDCASVHHSNSRSRKKQSEGYSRCLTQGCWKRLLALLPWVIAAVARTANLIARILSWETWPFPSAFVLFTMGALVGAGSTEFEGHLVRLTPLKLLG